MNYEITGITIFLRSRLQITECSPVCVCWLIPMELSSLPCSLPALLPVRWVDTISELTSIPVATTLFHVQVLTKLYVSINSFSVTSSLSITCFLFPDFWNMSSDTSLPMSQCPSLPILLSHQILCETLLILLLHLWSRTSWKPITGSLLTLWVSVSYWAFLSITFFVLK